MRQRLNGVLSGGRGGVLGSTLGLALLVAFLARPAVAVKFDLSPYSGPMPSVGDSCVHELSTGSTRTLEVIDVSPWKKGFRLLAELTETGLDPTLVETFEIPGKKSLFGDAFAAGLFIDLKKPATMFKHLVKPGKTNKIRGKGKAFFEGGLVGKARYRGGWVFAGLEPLDTPAASYPDTAVLEVVLVLRVKDRVFGDLVEAQVESIRWWARGLGEVASRQRTTAWVNGSLVDDSGWIDAWLVECTLAGQPTP